MLWLFVVCCLAIAFLFYHLNRSREEIIKRDAIIVMQEKFIKEDSLLLGRIDSLFGECLMVNPEDQVSMKVIISNNYKSDTLIFNKQ